MHIFFRVFVFKKHEFCANLAYVYFHEYRLKENFACINFCEIDQDSQNSRKFVHAKISTLNVQTKRTLHRPRKI